jgi:oxygen-independent coproporphyrinogen-3 oxidase
VEAIREVGLPTFNMDLIYGAHGESVGDWETTLQRALELAPPHVSAYGLTVEPGTPLAEDPPRHPDDDDQADKYPLANRWLESAGLMNYEISNWAMPGHESRHNRLYWAQCDYRGFGCAAHSHASGRRWWNVRTPERYIEMVTNSDEPVSSSEQLDDDTRALEALQLLIRMREGVPTTAFTNHDLDELAPFLQHHGDRVALSRAGRLMANAISLRLRAV